MVKQLFKGILVSTIRIFTVFAMALGGVELYITVMQQMVDTVWEKYVGGGVIAIMLIYWMVRVLLVDDDKLLINVKSKKEKK